jgi:hypothetical protein
MDSQFVVLLSGLVQLPRIVNLSMRLRRYRDCLP